MVWAMATSGAYRTTPRVVSISEKPRRAASAASQTTCSGLSRALVQWPWFAGVRRALILRVAIMISTTFIVLTTSRRPAGVSPRVTSRTCARLTSGLTSMLATLAAGMAMAAGALSTSIA